jgi:alkylation response protein AidB-like acyl-CoA dehydrogenase
MRLVLTEEQEELRDSVRRFLSDRAPMSRVRQVMESPDGYDRALWERMAGELGLQGVAVPEGYGGSGLGSVELSVVMEELGRSLLPSPFLASAVLATSALLAIDDEEARRDLLPDLASGRRVATLAVAEDICGWDAGRSLTAASLHGGEWRIRGAKTPVLDGASADLLLVVAQTDGELGFFAVDGDAEGVQREQLAGLDLTRRMARLRLADAPARRLVAEDGAGALGRTLDAASVALAAEQLGGLQRCLDMSVAYAGARAQFGRPIGSFQAIKHLCADMHVAMELARSAVRFAAWAAAESPDELPVAAALARAYCSEAYFKVAADTIQVHGGIGFTWEHDAHLYYRRAKSSELLFGSPAQARAQLADRLGI